MSDKQTFALYIEGQSCRFWGEGSVMGGALAAFSMSPDAEAPDIVVGFQKGALIISYSQLPPAEMVVGIAGQNKAGGDFGLYWLAEQHGDWPDVVTSKHDRKSGEVYLVPYDEGAKVQTLLAVASRSSAEDLAPYAEIAIERKIIGTSPYSPDINAYGLLPAQEYAEVSQEMLLTVFSNAARIQDNEAQTESNMAPGGGAGIAKKLAQGDAAALSAAAKQYESFQTSPNYAELLQVLANKRGKFQFDVKSVSHECALFTGSTIPTTDRMEKDCNSDNLTPDAYGAGAVMIAEADGEKKLIIQPTPGSSIITFIGKDKENPVGVVMTKWVGFSSDRNKTPVWETKVFGRTDGMKVFVSAFGKQAVQAALCQFKAHGEGGAPVHNPHHH